MVQIGTLAASENLPASVDLDKIVTRHAAILGSTGSGKSNTVAGFLKALVSGAFPSARVIVIDPHGEYGAALRADGKAVRGVLDVRPRVDLVALRPHRRADLVFGIGRVRALASEGSHAD